MKQILLSFVLIFPAVLVYGQGSKTAAPSAPSITITYNGKQSKVNPDFVAFPIDKAFTLEIDSIPTNKILGIHVYPVRSKNGYRTPYDIKDNIHPYNDTVSCRASFELKGSDTTIGAGFIILHFPALQAEMKFDISITKQFSPLNLKKALNLNKALDSLNFIKSNSPLNSDKALTYATKVALLFDDFSNSVNDVSKYHSKEFCFFIAKSGGHLVQPYAFIRDINSYEKYLYDPLQNYYRVLVSGTPKNNPDISSASKDTCFFTHDFFTQPQIDTISNILHESSSIINRLYILQKICSTPGSFSDIAFGIRQIDFTSINKVTDYYDFTARAKNIDNARKFMDSLDHALLNLKSDAKNRCKSLITLTEMYSVCLRHNSDLINKYSGIISDQTLLNSTENIWVIGQNTNSADLTTLSSRKLTVNAGITGIFNYDNSKTINCIPKLFLGIDYHFKPYDKNTDFSDIQQVAPESDTLSHIIEAQKSSLYKWSLTLGVTFGPMTNKDFNNVYGSFSFTLGPSYTIGKYLKISSGVAAIERYSNNPLLSSVSHVIFGPYASVSVDFDLLNAVSSITGSLFK